MSRLPLEDRLLIIQLYYGNGRSETETVKEFVKEKGMKNHRDSPDRKTIRDLVHKFETTFSLFDAHRSGRPSTSDEKKEEVSQSVLEHEGKVSCRRLSHEVGLPTTTVHRILRTQ